MGFYIAEVHEYIEEAKEEEHYYVVLTGENFSAAAKKLGEYLEGCLAFDVRIAEIGDEDHFCIDAEKLPEDFMDAIY